MQNKRQPSLRFIYKIHSKQLKKHKWNMTLPLQDAMRNHPDMIVSIGSSQMLRWIDELNGISNIDDKVKEIQRKIRIEKKKPKSRESSMLIREFYSALYDLQFVEDYVCIVMDTPNDYDRANNGFTINGIKFRRLLGTSGGVKTKTIVYVNETLYPELKRRIDNGRDMTKELVPAKLEAYQALVCSGSTPLPPPRGFIVVDDCVTHFNDDVILINDEEDGEPKLTYVDGYEIEHNDSDGYGLMSPEYSRLVNEYLTGDGEHTISGMNTRYAWEKGMVYTFDFVEFAEKVAGTYEITDAWGARRDVRDADIILTTSMLKLYDSYESWEDYYRNCLENHYMFSTPKVTPDKLENVRLTNYQFLQSYEFTDDEIKELCQPTVDELADVLGMDYRKSIAFLAGSGLDEQKAKNFDNDYVKALMIEPDVIYDPFVRKSINSMLTKRMTLAKKGSIRVDGNYAMISGDPYALCQSMFGLEITGLLKAGEVYHKYWIDKGAKEIVCFRAPMTNYFNIRKMSLADADNTRHWYQYIETALIYNAWDTACEAMNGSDKDGDTNMCTDNQVLLRNTTNLRTIMCVQRKAEKKIVTEDDIIAANKMGFDDSIGTITNYVTSMFDVQAAFNPESREYKDLAYRIMCGQLFQQNSIDRIKGIVAKPMPEYWYDVRAIRKSDRPDKEYQLRIAANRKPHFMIYVYPQLRRRYSDYSKSTSKKYNRMYVDEETESVRYEANEFNDGVELYMPVGENKCVVNRICDFMEVNLPPIPPNTDKPFDYEILKSNVEYSKRDYEAISKLYEEFLTSLDNYYRAKRMRQTDDDAPVESDTMLIDYFKAECEKVCTNEDELCDIVLDICYTKEKTKLFAWAVCGDTIIRNLLRRNGMQLRYPVLADQDDYEFTYGGNYFKMETATVEEDNE